MNKLEKYLIPVAMYLENNKVIKAISGGLMSLMPVLMLGAMASLLQQLPIEIYQNFLQTSGMMTVLVNIVNVTTNLLALYASFSIANTFVRNESLNGTTAGLISLLSFLLITPTTIEGEGWGAVTSLPFTWLDAKGLFTAMIVAIITGYIYKYLIENEVTIKLPESVPPIVSSGFSGIIPGLIIPALFAVISGLVNLTPAESVHDLIYSLIALPLTNIGSSIWTALLVYTLIGLSWFFGIHGIAIISVIMPIWMAADAENISSISAGGAPQNIITYNWLETVSNIGGAGATLGLVILTLILAKSKRYKQLGKLTIAPSLFNINEPVVFGFPMVLNATTMIPFIFMQPLLIGIAYVLTTLGILPVGNGVGAPIRLPIISGLFLGGWRLGLWQLFALVLTTVSYYPFFKILDKQALIEENKDVEEI